jgi:hypothetical protein
MSEKTLWQWLKGKTKGWHIVRIESSTMLGIPDVNYCAETGMEGWVELKFAERWPPSGKPPFALSSQHKLTPQQEFFLATRAEHGSCSGILAQIGDERFFISAAYASEFNTMTEAQFRERDILEQWLKEGYYETATA